MVIKEIENVVKNAFEKADYEIDNIKIIKSNRPDLCDYQCDDVFKLTKIYYKSPAIIGTHIVSIINELPDFNEYFDKVEFAAPGFINITVSNKLINKYLKIISDDIKAPFIDNNSETYVLDFGGANVAKPLHVGHLRTAIVGESISRIIRFVGNNTISDVHLGDYGLQIGEVIYGVLRDKKTLDEIDITYLDRIYPEMSKICKENEDIKNECANITKELQEGNPEYQILWKKILEVSKEDIKKNYDYLSVHFDYWYGESDSYKDIPAVEKILEEKELLKQSEGALIVDVSKEDDKKELPPLIFKKSNGAYLYPSTDLATILQRKRDFNPDHILYVTDLRQALHFEQVFRTSDKADIVSKDKLEHLGYGTVNGEDGKPFKTRNGDSPKLENLFNDAKKLFISKKESNKDMSLEDIDKIVNAIIKFADLQNSIDKDYIFDLNKFTDVSGKTGPYILYTYLRINKIIKDEKFSNTLSNNIYNKADRDLRIKVLDYVNAIDIAFKERKPHYIAEYVYNLCVACNVFYQTNHLAGLEDKTNKNDWLYLLNISNKIIKEMLDLLVIDIPSVM